VRKKPSKLIMLRLNTELKVKIQNFIQESRLVETKITASEKKAASLAT